MKDCARGLDLLYASLDGEIDAAGALELDAHLATCAACRSAAASIEGAQAALRELPLEPMPEADFQAVLDRTVRSETPRGEVVPFPVRRRVVWGSLGLAAAIVAAALIVPALLRRPAEPTEQEIAQAREGAIRALAIAGRALRRAETAGEAVVRTEVSPALRRVPVRWDRLADDSVTRRTRS